MDASVEEVSDKASDKMTRSIRKEAREPSGDRIRTSDALNQPRTLQPPRGIVAVHA
jgi:hypothetical protein